MSWPSGLAQLVRRAAPVVAWSLHGAECSPNRQATCTGCLYSSRVRRCDRDRYKWIALSNATLAVLLATLDASITLIAMPDIFRGIHLDPLVPANSFYLLWMILGYLVVTSVLIVSLGRLGDMVGRVQDLQPRLRHLHRRLAAAGDRLDDRPRRARTYLIVFRIVQGIGGACLLANAAAIITDAFPANQRGMALGINNIVGVSGMFIGLVLGGMLAPIDWRLVFLISVPVGLFGTVWAYLEPARAAARRAARAIDWCRQRHLRARPGPDHGRGHLRDPALRRPRRPAGGARACSVLLAGAVASPRRLRGRSSGASAEPMFRLPLFRIRAFTFGTLSTFLSAVARGGLMFMLIIWLQGIWLPQHGYDFTETPLWAGIYMLPLTVGMLLAGPDLGLPVRPLRRAAVRDRRDARCTALSFGLLHAAADRLLLPGLRARSCCSSGSSMGLFASPNRAAVMNSLPPGDRGAGGGDEPDLPELGPGAVDRDLLHADDHRAWPSTLPAHAERRACRPTASPPPTAHHVGHAAAGLDPVRRLPRLQPDPAPARPARARRRCRRTTRRCSPGSSLLPAPDLRPVPATGSHAAFTFAIVACLVAAAASLLRGGRMVHDETVPVEPSPRSAQPTARVTFTPAHRGGSGPPLVCLHGFTDTWRTWELVLPALERRHDVLAPTLAGHAGGPPIAGPVDGRRGRRRGRARDGRGRLRDRAPRRQLARRLRRAAARRARARGARSSRSRRPAAGRRATSPSRDAARLLHDDAGALREARAPHADAIVATPGGPPPRDGVIVAERFEHIPAELLAHQIRGAAGCTRGAPT